MRKIGHFIIEILKNRFSLLKGMDLIVSAMKSYTGTANCVVWNTGVQMCENETDNYTRWS